MSREAWQADCALNNSSASEGQFLSPLIENEEDLWRLYQNSTSRNFDNFTAQHNQAITSFDQELRALIPQIHEEVRAGMQTGVEQRYVPPYALARLEPTFTQTAIRVAGPSMLDGNLAVYQQLTDIMTVGIEAADYDLKQTITHELAGHKLSGGRFVTCPDGTVARLRRGFVNHDPAAGHASARHYDLDEAIQDHLALSYLYGQFDVIDPDGRADRHLTYYEQRKLLSELILRSGGIIDLAAITRSSFEDTDESRIVITDRRIMCAQAQYAYGPGAYFKLNLLLESIELSDLSAEELVEQIKGPILNADGSVKRVGSITTEDFVDDALLSSFDSFDLGDY